MKWKKRYYVLCFAQNGKINDWKYFLINIPPCGCFGILKSVENVRRKNIQLHELQHEHHWTLFIISSLEHSHWICCLCFFFALVNLVFLNCDHFQAFFIFLHRTWFMTAVEVFFSLYLLFSSHFSQCYFLHIRANEKKKNKMKDH